jgi:hypothetical protein
MPHFRDGVKYNPIDAGVFVEVSLFFGCVDMNTSRRVDFCGELLQFFLNIACHLVHGIPLIT